MKFLDQLPDYLAAYESLCSMQGPESGPVLTIIICQGAWFIDYYQNIPGATVLCFAKYDLVLFFCLCVAWLE